MRLRLLPLALAVFAAVPALSQQPAKRPITFADLMAMKRVSDPQISPSGRWVLFSVTDVSLQANTRTNHLWAVPLDGKEKEHQLTSGKGESNGRFAPDGKHISWTADDADGTSQIWLADWNDTDASISPASQHTHLSTGADGAIWSPDSQHLLLTSSVYPECSTTEGVEKVHAALANPQSALADRVNPGLAPDAAPGKLGQTSTLVNSNLEPSTWQDEANCDKAKDEAAAKSPVKAEIWTSLLYRHWDHYTGEKRSHILLISATDGNAIRDLTPASNVGTAETPTFSLGGPLGYAWSPDSKEIAYSTNLDQLPAASTNNDIFTLSIDNSTDTQQARTTTKAVKVSTSPGSDDAPAYSPDGKYLAFRSQARNGFESDKFNLAVMDRQTRKIIKPLTSTGVNAALTFQGWVDEFSWTSDSANLAFATSWHGEEPYGIVSLTEHTPGYYIHRLSSEFPGELTDVRVMANYTIFATRMQVDRPSELVILNPTRSDPETGKKLSDPSVQVLTHVNDQLLNQLSLSALEPFWFPGANNTKVEGFLLRPPNFDPNKKYPLKFLMHGGPQTAWGDSWSYRWNWQLMAASGYVVIGINRRGSTGYGQQFVDEVSGDWGGRAYQDLMLGLDYAEKKYPFIDKTRECALGASYGGYMADWVLTHTDRFKCIVTHDGMSDPESAFGTTEELWFPEWEFRPLASTTKSLSSRPERSEVERPASGTTTQTLSSRPAAKSSGAPSKPAASSPGWVGSQEANAVVEQTQPSYPWDFYGKPDSQNPYRRWSPMLAIKNAKTPTLIIHSQRDYRLDISQGLELFTALQLRGVPSKFLYFPDEGHWVLKPQNSQLWNATVSDWCDRWTHSNQYASTNTIP